MIRVMGGGDPILYAVAEPDAFFASEIIRSKVALAGEIIEDLGRVSDELILALELKAGEFKRI